MTDIPAGWYDDPENHQQHRYWDGTSWTEHRAQKAPSGGSQESSAWQVVPDAFTLLVRSWRQIVVLSVLPLALTAVGVILIYLALDSVFDPALSDIIDRITDPGFDPENNAADDRFLDSVRFDPSVGSVTGAVVGGLILLLSLSLGPLLAAIQLASVQQGRPLSIGGTIGATVRRLPRIIGIGILWGLGAVVALVAGGFVFALLVSASALTLLLLAPAAIAAVVFLWPYAQMAWLTLVLAPRDTPPLRATMALIRGRWGAFAVRMLVLTLVLIGVSFGTNIVTAPLGIASIWAGFLAGLLLQAAQTALSVAGSVVIYGWGGGPVDPELQGPIVEDTPLS